VQAGRRGPSPVVFQWHNNVIIIEKIIAEMDFHNGKTTLDIVAAIHNEDR
jgi:hypothetical protein